MLANAPSSLSLTFAIAFALTISSPANAECSASSRFSFSFSTATSETLNYGSSYTLTATNAIGQSRTVTLSFVIDGLATNVVGGFSLPAVTNLINDGGTVNNLVIGGILSGRTANLSSNTRVITTRFALSSPVQDFTVQMNDVDFSDNQFRDWIQVAGTNGPSNYSPTISTPHGTNNLTGGPKSTAASSVLLGPSASPLTVSADRAVGISSSDSNSNTGTINASIAQPVDQIEIRYGNHPLTGAETQTGQQAFGIQGFSFCPLPQLALNKTSAPLTTASQDPNRFAIPGSDIVYTLVVTNNDGGAVDPNSLIITDNLPSSLSFRNADFDDGGPVTTNFEFIPGQSGLTLTANDITYSNNGGASYSYSPSAGYDNSINSIKLNLKGAMAGNSSFTVRFRARIN